jgi:hypothetical protein
MLSRSLPLPLPSVRTASHAAHQHHRHRVWPRARHPLRVQRLHPQRAQLALRRCPRARSVVTNACPRRRRATALRLPPHRATASGPLATFTPLATSAPSVRLADNAPAASPAAAAGQRVAVLDASGSLPLSAGPAGPGACASQRREVPADQQRLEITITVPLQVANTASPHQQRAAHARRQTQRRLAEAARYI